MGAERSNMDYKKFAEALGLKMEISRLKELDECSVEGPTEKVLMFQNETYTYGTGWYDLGNGTSVYCFVE